MVWIGVGRRREVCVCAIKYVFRDKHNGIMNMWRERGKKRGGESERERERKRERKRDERQ